MALEVPKRLDVDECGELDDAGDRRAYRAYNELMLVIPQTDDEGICTGMYEVHSESGKCYDTALDMGTCTCPDYTHNDATCKHLRRVAIEIDQGQLPKPEESADWFFESLSDRRDEYVARVEDLLERFIRHQDFIREIDSITGEE